jgi:hypothetical protein
MNKKENHLNATTVACLTAAGTLFIAMMYASGQAIRTSYLDVYGLYEALMPWSPQQMMFMGFQWGAFDIFMLLAFLAAYVFAVFLTLQLVEWLGRRARKRQTGGAEEMPYRREREANVHSLLIATIVFVLAGIVVLILWGWVEVQSRHGRDLANTQKAEIDAFKCEMATKPEMPYARVIRSVGNSMQINSPSPKSGQPKLAPDDTGLVEGYVVSCDSHFCALYPYGQATNEGKKVVMVPLDNVKSFSVEKPPKTCQATNATSES